MNDHINLFKSLLLKWNKKINLVAPGETSNLEERHLRDSQQLCQHIPDKNIRIIDLGSGGGFPGIPISISGVHEVILIESIAKKCSFLREFAIQSNLNIKVLNARIEDVGVVKFLDNTGGEIARISDNEFIPVKWTAYYKGEIELIRYA